MLRTNTTTGLLPSILDRLLDDEPEVTQETIPDRFQNLHQLKHAVTRDLEALFNTRQELLDAPPEELREVQGSLLTYGLPDFTACSLLNPDDRILIQHALEQAIVTFEPRLARVHVTVDNPNPHDQALRFHIEAFLHVEPAPELVTFDAMLQLNTQEYRVQGQK